MWWNVQRSQWAIQVGWVGQFTKTLNPPLPYIFWSVWTWGFTRWHPKYTIPIQKFEYIAIEWSIFWAFFGDFWGREPDLHSEFSDFQNLSVFSNFLAWNHIVCHRYRLEKVQNTFFSTLEPLWKSALHHTPVFPTLAIDSYQGGNMPDIRMGNVPERY